MAIDAWLPVGFVFPDGSVVHRAIFEGANWQIFEVRGGGSALVARDWLKSRWTESGVLSGGELTEFRFDDAVFWSLSSSHDYALRPVQGASSPRTKNQALAFAEALKATRERDRDSPLHDAIYIEKLSRVLPTYTLSPQVGDDIVLGAWLTGGVPVSVSAFRRLRSLVGWMGEPHLLEVVTRAGLPPSGIAVEATRGGKAKSNDAKPASKRRGPTLPKGSCWPASHGSRPFLSSMSSTLCFIRNGISPWESASRRQWFYTDPPGAGRPLRFSGWWTISVGRAFRSRPRKRQRARTFTRRAGRLPKSSQARCAMRRRC